MSVTVLVLLYLMSQIMLHVPSCNQNTSWLLSSLFCFCCCFVIVPWRAYLFSTLAGKLECILFMTFLYPPYSFLSILCMCVSFYVKLPPESHYPKTANIADTKVFLAAFYNKAKQKRDRNFHNEIRVVRISSFLLSILAEPPICCSY